MVSLGRIIRFSLIEKLEGTKNSFFEFDKKDAHQEKVLLLKIANFEDLMMLKSFSMEVDCKSDICKLAKHFLSSFIITGDLSICLGAKIRISDGNCVFNFFHTFAKINSSPGQVEDARIIF